MDRPNASTKNLKPIFAFTAALHPLNGPITFLWQSSFTTTESTTLATHPLFTSGWAMNPEEFPPPSLNLPFPQQKNVLRTSRRSVKKQSPATTLQCSAWPIEPSPESLNPGNQGTKSGYRDHISSPTTLLRNLR